MIEFSVAPLSWAGSNCARTKVVSMQTAVRRGRKRIKESYQNIGKVIFLMMVLSCAQTSAAPELGTNGKRWNHEAPKINAHQIRQSDNHAIKRYSEKYRN